MFTLLHDQVMSGYGLIEEDQQHPYTANLKWYHNVGDFGNLFKAFIGTNYLSLSYGFKQSGLVLGVLGLALVSVLTDHTCMLIVKCKHHVMDDMCARYMEKCKAEKGDEDLAIDQAAFLRKRLEKNLQYADIGHLCFGTIGSFLVNLFLIITQLGFCIGYSIFVGNTLYHLLPMKPMDLTPVLNISEPLNVFLLPPDSESGNVYPTNETDVVRLSKQWLDSLDDAGIMRRSLKEPPAGMRVGENPTTNRGTASSENTTSNNVTLISSDPAGPVLASHTDSMAVDLVDVGTTSVPSSSTLHGTGRTNTTVNAIRTTLKTTVSTELTTATIAYSMAMGNETELWPDLEEEKVLPLYILVLIPLPIFVIFTFFRQVRHMSIISALANAAIIVGFSSLLIYIMADFHVSPTISLFEWATLPVFIGQVIAGYEAIGTILPIESSMEGNRHNFAAILHVTVVLFTMLIGVIAVMGYLRFGEEIQQILAQNIPADGAMVLLIDATLIFGVICTYPLQIYPVVEILEGLLFAEGRVCGPARKHRVASHSLDSSDEDDVAAESLLTSEEDNLEMSLPVAVFVPKSVPAWKRNLFRTAVAIFTSGMAVLLRNVFAYTGALVGALGSCPLAFVLPCLFHLKLRYAHLSRAIIVKDCVIMVFGAVACVVSVIVSVQEMVYRL